MSLSPESNAHCYKQNTKLKPTHCHLVLGFYIGASILHPLLLTGRHRFSALPLEVKRNSVIVTCICRSNLSCVLRSDGKNSSLDHLHKISHMEALLLALDVQYTEQEHWCPTTDKQGAQNAAVLHLAWCAILQNRPTGKDHYYNETQRDALFLRFIW